MSQVPKGEATTLAPISAAYSSLIEKLNRPHIPSLDGIRGIAALLVVFYHFGMYLHFYPLPGFFGVLTFFVLSGFLITWLLLKEDAKQATFRSDISTFAARSESSRRSTHIGSSPLGCGSWHIEACPGRLPSRRSFM